MGSLSCDILAVVVASELLHACHKWLLLITLIKQPIKYIEHSDL